MPVLRATLVEMHTQGSGPKAGYCPSKKNQDMRQKWEGTRPRAFQQFPQPGQPIFGLPIDPRPKGVGPRKRGFLTLLVSLGSQKAPSQSTNQQTTNAIKKKKKKKKKNTDHTTAPHNSKQRRTNNPEHANQPARKEANKQANKPTHTHTHQSVCKLRHTMSMPPLQSRTASAPRQFPSALLKPSPPRKQERYVNCGSIGRRTCYPDSYRCPLRHSYRLRAVKHNPDNWQQSQTFKQPSNLQTRCPEAKNRNAGNAYMSAFLCVVWGLRVGSYACRVGMCCTCCTSPPVRGCFVWRFGHVCSSVRTWLAHGLGRLVDLRTLCGLWLVMSWLRPFKVCPGIGEHAQNHAPCN